MVSHPGLIKKRRMYSKQTNFNIYIAPWSPKTQRCLEDRELNQTRSKPDTVDRPVRTAISLCTIINSTQYCNTDSPSSRPSGRVSSTSCGHMNIRKTYCSGAGSVGLSCKTSLLMFSFEVDTPVNSSTQCKTPASCYCSCMEMAE